MIKVRSSIKPRLMRHIILRGSIFAVMGSLIFLYAGIFMPVAILSAWGIPLLFIAGGLLAIGLLPYRRLSRLERKPDELAANESSLIFHHLGRPVMTIPVTSIKRMAYLDHGNKYGIGLWLKDPLPEKIIIHDRRYKPDASFNADLFFSYFTERSYQELAVI